MRRFIPMPWDEEREPRWSEEETRLAVQLAAEGLSRHDIADRLAEAGFEPRCDTSITDKLRRMRR